MADCLAEVSARSIGKSNGLFHRPQHGVSPHAPRQRLASPVGSRQATGPRRRARTGRVAGDGQPALLGLLGGRRSRRLGRHDRHRGGISWRPSLVRGHRSRSQHRARSAGGRRAVASLLVCVRSVQPATGCCGYTGSGRFRVMLEDHLASLGVPGDSFFDNVVVRIATRWVSSP